MLIRPPGVYRPQADTWLLARAMRDAPVPPGGRALDACTGTGVLAIHAALAGAASVTAVDISRAAVATAWLNSRIRGIGVEVVRGDVATALGDRRFDVVVANPPYVPSAHPGRGRTRAWDAGHHGRVVLNQLCHRLPALLAHNGIGLIVHSTVCDPDRTLTQLRGGGLKAAIVARAILPFGPVMRRRAAWLEATGLIGPRQRHEELVVIRADRI
ncbi:HemK2/MTQ2 family protein methyltransferase [Nocardia sp. NPDC050630]|uniref:HemK2/MTQ2 family protein methyltransferase n=1 Tax=Nocardia sp. NPDC050630 TaxID=3364321 RepID=UPI0037992E38